MLGDRCPVHPEPFVQDNSWMTSTYFSRFLVIGEANQLSDWLGHMLLCVILAKWLSYDVVTQTLKIYKLSNAGL